MSEEQEKDQQSSSQHKKPGPKPKKGELEAKIEELEQRLERLIALCEMGFTNAGQGNTVVDKGFNRWIPGAKDMRRH